MKILSIHAQGNEQWNTPLSLLNEFVRRGHEVAICNILQNGNYSDDGLIELINNYKEFDIVIHFDYGRFDSPFLDKHHFSKAFTIMEAGDEPQNYDKNILKAPKFDYIFTPDYDSYVKYKEEGFNADWITHWADSTIYKPWQMEQKFHAVSSRGKGGSQFLDNLEQITQGKFINMNGFIGENHAKFLCCAPIVIQNSRFGEITRRIFEAMACQRLVITDRLNDSKKLNELFKENESIIFYDTMSECISKLNYYIARPELAAEIALNGYNEVLKNHTQINRYYSIINKYEEWKRIASR